MFNVRCDDFNRESDGFRKKKNQHFTVSPDNRGRTRDKNRKQIIRLNNYVECQIQKYDSKQVFFFSSSTPYFFGLLTLLLFLLFKTLKHTFIKWYTTFHYCITQFYLIG